MHFLHHLTSNLNPTQGHACPWQTAQRQKEGRTRPELSAPRDRKPYWLLASSLRCPRVKTWL